MDTLEQILRAHARKYPAMEPTDGVKLLYQNTFGGGHMIRDMQACKQMLLREYENTPQISAAPLLEDIGNGIVRVMLSSLEESGYTPEELADAFIRSSQICCGALEDFLPKLELLRKLTAEGVFAFSPRELDAYLETYKQAGYPMVSHSEAYRQAYKPAYRIVLRSLLPEKIL